MQKQTNEYYIEGIATGDSRALSAIYDEFLPITKRLIRRDGGADADTEDIFNQVLMQLFARLRVKRFEISSTFESYLISACRNLWRRELNKKIKKRVTNQGYTEQLDVVTDDAQAILQQEQWELYEEKFAELSENCRDVMTLHLRKMSGKDIMQQLNYASETTVRQRIFKCKSRLVKLIRGDRRYIA